MSKRMKDNCGDATNLESRCWLCRSPGTVCEDLEIMLAQSLELLRGVSDPAKDGKLHKGVVYQFRCKDHEACDERRSRII